MRIFQISIVILFLIACKNPTKTDYSQELVNTTWLLESFTLSDTTVIYSDDFIIWEDIEKYTIGFYEDDTLYCQISTNSVSGTYQCPMEGKIEIMLLSTTFVGVPPDGYSDQYWEALSEASYYELENDTLKLFYNQSRSFLTFRRNES